MILRSQKALSFYLKNLSCFLVLSDKGSIIWTTLDAAFLEFLRLVLTKLDKEGRDRGG